MLHVSTVTVRDFNEAEHLPMAREWWKGHWQKNWPGMDEAQFYGPPTYFTKRGKVLYVGDVPVLMVFLHIDDETKFAMGDLLTRNPFLKLPELDKYTKILFQHVVDSMRVRFNGEGVICAPTLTKLKKQEALLTDLGFTAEDKGGEKTYWYKLGPNE